MQLQMTSSPNQKWTLVLARDAKADGRFVYAVKSTGVFCRPSCPSRRPKRENVEFFDSPTQAQQAGYRACRRCTPLERNLQTQRVEAACRYIDQNLDVTLSLTAISRHVAISPFHFQRLFKRILGISPREYQQARRAGKFRQALLGEGTEIRCTVISTELGKLLVATTQRGVCSVRFGESEAALLRELKHDFDAA
ncbi:MAG: bifunctional transcriptional activator/DNA repair enzyme AdaA, partial [Candidatus Angelobacter sp.]